MRNSRKTYEQCQQQQSAGQGSHDARNKCTAKMLQRSVKYSSKQDNTTLQLSQRLCNDIYIAVLVDRSRILTDILGTMG